MAYLGFSFIVTSIVLADCAPYRMYIYASYTYYYYYTMLNTGIPVGVLIHPAAFCRRVIFFF